MYKNKAKLIGMVIGRHQGRVSVSELVSMVKLMGNYLGYQNRLFKSKTLKYFANYVNNTRLEYFYIKL